MSWQKTTSREFEPIRLLGRGAFGAVLLVRKKATGEQYALKVMRKDHLVDRNAIQVARIEREVGAVVRQHPFLVRLCYSFQSTTRLYLVTEYLEGGSLDARLPLTLTEAQRATAQLTLAIEFLHSVGVIHRDIKSANVLFDAKNDARLADFGLAAYCEDAVQRRMSFCGTIEYMSPELFLKKKREEIPKKKIPAAVDWWALGVLLYEMLRGKTPFNPTTTKGGARALFENILHADLDFGHPAFTDIPAVDCISRLLNRDVQHRADAGDLRSHPFLAAAIRGYDAVVHRSLVDSTPSSLSSVTPASPVTTSPRSAVSDDVETWTDDDATSATAATAGLQVRDEELCESARLYLSESDDIKQKRPTYRPDAFKGFSFCHLDVSVEDDSLPTTSNRRKSCPAVIDAKPPRRERETKKNRRKSSPAALLKGVGKRITLLFHSSREAPVFQNVSHPQ